MHAHTHAHPYIRTHTHRSFHPPCPCSFFYLIFSPLPLPSILRYCFLSWKTLCPWQYLSFICPLALFSVLSLILWFTYSMYSALFKPAQAQIHTQRCSTFIDLPTSWLWLHVCVLLFSYFWWHCITVLPGSCVFSERQGSWTNYCHGYVSFKTEKICDLI